MQLSACGLSCSECVVLGKKWCTKENALARSCPIFQCVEKKGINSCIECSEHVDCDIFKNAIKDCPLMPTINTCIMCGSSARERLNIINHSLIRSFTGGAIDTF